MKLTRFAKFAWFVLAYNLLVIGWGAYVRASRSGDGCGSHWPLCNGEVIPIGATTKTLIEFSHRISSGLALISMIVLVVWARRAFARGHLVRRTASLGMFFMLTEAAIGAGLVLFEYVAENKSMARAYWMSAHLINTFLLVAMIALTAWGGTLSERSVAGEDDSGQRWVRWLLAASILGTLLLGVSGAITALGGTLFPVSSLAEGLKQDLSPTAHILIRLRFFHPFIALGVSALLIVTAGLARAQRLSEWTRHFSNAVIGLVLLQLLAGLVNLLLHAPNWLQIVHLLLSDLLWIGLVLLTFSALSSSKETRSPAFSPLAIS
ncbi:MAG: COX15/CtaA family protein [Blastocatellia bacterium]|nr:COX15/CtaA family protein [Blastocatellia bacterium]